MQSVII